MSSYIIRNIFLILTFIYLLYKSRHAYHILQLESYKSKRYLKWIKKNKTISLRELILLVLSVTIMINNKLGLILSSIWILILIVFRKKHIEKKALIITSRIKRMYFTEIIILTGGIILANIYNNAYIEIVFNILINFSYIFVLLINIINLPIEKIIQLKFYNRAKKKLLKIRELTVIGITGSYGKTSTKYILGTILSQKYNTLITPESYNTTMGVVRTINEKLNNTHQVFVCEMGAKDIGDIREICKLVKPKYGVLTAIGPQHLETFKTIENVKKTKLELVESLTSEGIAFVNGEDENIKNISIEKSNIKYGINKKCEYYATNIQIDEFGSSFDVITKKLKSMHVKTKLLGSHNIINIVGAIAVATELGLSKDEIIRGIKFLKPVTHRLELKRNQNGSIIIDDAYNSNINGAKAALEVLKKFSNMQKILITPGIVDLGKQAKEYNEELGKYAAESCDFIILVGKKQAKPIKEGIISKGFNNEKIYIANTLAEAISKMNELINENTVVLFENDLPDNYL